MPGRIALAAAVLLAGVVGYQQVRIGKLSKKVARLVEDRADDEAATEMSPSRGGAVSGPQVTALAQRLAGLEKGLRRVYALVVGQSAAAQASAGAGISEEEKKRLAALREDVDAVLTGQALSTEAGQKRLAELAAKVTEKVQEKKKKHEQEMQDHVLLGEMQQFGEKHKMNEDQWTKMVEVVAAVRNKRQEMDALVKQGKKTYEEAAAESVAIKEEAQKFLQHVLSKEQFEAFKRDGVGRWLP